MIFVNKIQFNQHQRNERHREKNLQLILIRLYHDYKDYFDRVDVSWEVAEPVFPLCCSWAEVSNMAIDSHIPAGFYLLANESFSN